MAIPYDELVRLGLRSEAPEAAKLFWAGEALTDMGDGRFYPSRHAPLPFHASISTTYQGIPSLLY